LPTIAAKPRWWADSVPVHKLRWAASDPQRANTPAGGVHRKNCNPPHWPERKLPSTGGVHQQLLSALLLQDPVE
jgi:hypothetical protein